MADALGAGNYTTGKFYMTVIVESVYNTQYGNANVKDANGDAYVIYGLYSADGTTRYDALSYKPVAGDELTVYGVVGSYAKEGVLQSYQMKNGWIDEVVAHDHVYEAVVTAPTCTADGYTTHTCTICQNTYKDGETVALGHTTENGVCENCGQEISSDNPGLTAKSYAHTLAKGSVAYNSAVTFSGVAWTFTGESSYTGWDSNASAKGVQLGSSSNPHKTLTVTSASFSNVSKVTINTSGASSISGNCKVYVGDTLVGTITLTTTATNYSFDVANITGEVKFVFTQTSSKAMYIKSIAVDYAE